MLTLDEIALRHGTDKSSAHHGYTKIYEKYFESFRHSEFVLCEAGYGGYHYPDRGGQSARAWREYFPNAGIIVTDLYDKTNIPDNVRFAKGSQDDPAFWDNLFDEFNAPDVFIDDASHISALCIATFKIMFPKLKKRGIYCIEDTHASHWSDHGFGGGDHPNTTINWIKALTDTLQAEHSGKPDVYGIESIHFYDKLIFIFKK